MTSILVVTAADEIAVWEGRSEQSVGLSNQVEDRARQFAQAGISSLDAVHLASAEEGQADIMLTCDDTLLRRSDRITRPQSRGIL